MHQLGHGVDRERLPVYLAEHGFRYNPRDEHPPTILFEDGPVAMPSEVHFESRSEIWEAISVAPRHIVAMVALGGFWSWASVRFAPDRLWAEAQTALQAGIPRIAATNLAWIYRLRTPTTRDRMLEAQIATAFGQADHALAALGHIPQDDPLAAQAFLLAGRLERKRNRLHAAESQFRRALRVNPALIDAHRELIYIYGIQSRRPEVDAEYRKLAALTDLTHHDLFTWAFTQFSPFRPDDAKILKVFVEADPDDRQSRLSLAEILTSEGGAPSELDRLLDGLPEADPDVLAIRAKIALTQGRLAEADALLVRGPADHVELNRLRGKLAIRRHDNAAAVNFYRMAQSRRPHDRMTTLELGQALTLAGDQEAAATFLDRAKHLNEIYNLLNRIRSAARENEAADLLKLAAAFERVGMIEEARHWFELAVSRDPINPESQSGLRRTRTWEKVESAHDPSKQPARQPTVR